MNERKASEDLGRKINLKANKLFWRKANSNRGEVS